MNRHDTAGLFFAILQTLSWVCIYLKYYLIITILPVTDTQTAWCYLTNIRYNTEVPSKVTHNSLQPMYHQAQIPKASCLQSTCSLRRCRLNLRTSYTSFRLQSHQVNSDICLSSLLFHHQRHFIIRGNVHMYIQTSRWSEMCCTEMTTVNWKLGGYGTNKLGMNGLPFLDMQSEPCNTKITWNLTLQTAHLLTLQFLMHDRFGQLRYQHQGNAVKSSNTRCRKQF